jgi:hypothetical protein
LRSLSFLASFLIELNSYSWIFFKRFNTSKKSTDSVFLAIKSLFPAIKSKIVNSVNFVLISVFFFLNLNEVLECFDVLFRGYAIYIYNKYNLSSR